MPICEVKYPSEKNETRKEKISRLENRLISLGYSGMAYSEYWDEVAKELNKLKEEK